MHDQMVVRLRETKFQYTQICLAHRGQFFSSWSTAEVWLIEINHWEYYTNQPPTSMVSQEAGGHHALLMATSDHSLPPLVILQRW